MELGGGGDDALRGSSGGDRVAGFGGDDVLGGAGNGFVEAKDGAVDRVSCGTGTDSASVDRKDLVSPDCETVYAG